MTRGPEVWRDLIERPPAPAAPRPNPPPARQNKNRPRRLRLGSAQLDSIHDRWSHGEPATAIAADVGIEPEDVRRIWRQRDELGWDLRPRDHRPRRPRT